MHDQAWKLRQLVESRAATPVADAPSERNSRAAVASKVGNPLASSQATPRPRVIAVSSGKGGVGKSNVAANLAYCAARAGRKVLLVDADLGLANLDLILGLTPARNLGHVVAGQIDLGATLMEGPGGLLFLPGASGLAEAADMDGPRRDQLLDELLNLERSADLVVIDTGAGIARNVIGFASAADDVLVVTTPEPTAVTDAYALIKVLCREGFAGRISVLVNQARDRAEGQAVFGRLAKTALRFLGRSLYAAGSLPPDGRLPSAVRARSLVVAAHPAAPVSRAIVALAARLLADGQAIHQAHAPGGLFRKIAGLFF